METRRHTGDIGFNKLNEMLEQGVQPEEVAVLALKNAIYWQTQTSVVGANLLVHLGYNMSNRLRNDAASFSNNEQSGHTETETV